MDDDLSDFASAYVKALERWASEARDPRLAAAIRKEARRYRSLCPSRERQLTLPLSASSSPSPSPSSRQPIRFLLSPDLTAQEEEVLAEALAEVLAVYVPERS